MAESKSFFDRIKTLFSTNVIVRNVGGKRLKVVDTARYQADGNPHTSKFIDRYGRLHGTRGTPISVYNQYNSFSATKIDLYGDYEAMDTDAIVSSALDIYADESTLKNDTGDVLAIRTDNENIRKILRNLFYDILNVEYNLWPWVRNLCKYGDFYLYLDVKEGLGITNVVPFSPYEMQREEGTDPEHVYMTKFIYEGPLGKGEFQNYEIAHFRLIGDTNFLPYGKSMLEGGRKIFKQLLLMEDAMLIHRIMRAPEKRVFKVDIGNIPPGEVDQYISQMMDKMKKVPFVDEKTGQYNLRFNMQNLLEDFYLPVRGAQSATNIETLPGLQYQAIEDVQYLESKLFAALKVPKAFLGYDETTEGKATLAALDIRFARTIERVQRIVISELTKIAIVHLYAQGYENADLVNFELGLTGPSIVYEQEKVALMKERVDLAGQIMDKKILSMKHIYSNIFNMTDDEIEFERNEIVEDIKQLFRHNQIENEGNDPVLTKESFGTPHDIASLHTKGSSKTYQINDGDTPEGGWPGAGRPAKNLNYGTDDHAFGRDPIGKKDVANTLKTSNGAKNTYKNNSPLSLEAKQLDGLLQSMSGMKIKTKEIISESLKPAVKKEENEPNLLNEDNLLDEL
jgi:hypothetical protein